MHTLTHVRCKSRTPRSRRSLNELELVYPRVRRCFAVTRIAAVSPSPGEMRLFWIALDGSVQMASILAGNHWVLRELVKAGSAHSASPIGGIAAISRIPTSAEVWYVGADGSVQDLYWYQGGQWQNFTLVEASGPPSASPTRGIAAVSRIPTSMEVWYVGSDGSVQDLYWYQSGQWPNFGGQWKNSRVLGA
jgi:hypothetical protein